MSDNTTLSATFPKDKDGNVKLSKALQDRLDALNTVPRTKKQEENSTKAIAAQTIASRPKFRQEAVSPKTKQPAPTKATPKPDNNTAVKNEENKVKITTSIKGVGTIEQKAVKFKKYHEVLPYLQTQYPKCFSLSPIPVAVGIHAQLLERAHEKFSKTDIRLFLSIYVNTDKYNESMLEGVKPWGQTNTQTKTTSSTITSSQL